METSQFASIKSLETQIADLRKVKTKLLEFPALVADAERALGSAKETLKDRQGQLAGIAGELMLSVQNAVTDAGLDPTKAKFTNEQARKAEHTRLMSEDNEAVGMKEAVARAEAVVRAAELAVTRIENDRRGWESYLQLSIKEADVVLGLVDLSFASMSIEKLSSRRGEA